PERRRDRALPEGGTPSTWSGSSKYALANSPKRERTLLKCWSSRPPPPRSCASSRARQPTSSRCSTRLFLANCYTQNRVIQRSFCAAAIQSLACLLRVKLGLGAISAQCPDYPGVISTDRRNTFYSCWIRRWQMVTSRILVTAKQKDELWERWKNGQSVLAISRALERSNKTGVQRIVALNGGIAPAPRCRAVAALKLEEREEISRGIA